MAVDPILLELEPAAHALGISPRTLRDLTASGVIPAVRIGRRVLYRRAGLKLWAQEREQYPVRQEEGRDDHPTRAPRRQHLPAEGRSVGGGGPGRPRKSQQARETVPLRVVEE